MTTTSTTRKSFQKSKSKNKTNMPKPIISLKIDVKKIDKTLLFVGQKGTYLDATIFEKDGGVVDEYGNAGYVAQSVSKEARERGEKGPIIGNYRLIQLR